MSLTCEIPDSDSCESFISPEDFEKLPEVKCLSCKTVINPGDEAGKISKFIYGGNGYEYEITPDWYCEKCTGISLNLTDLGYYFSLSDNMNDLLKEYHDLVAEEKKRAISTSIPKI